MNVSRMLLRIVQLSVLHVALLGSWAHADAAGTAQSDPAAVAKLESLLADVRTFETNVNQLIVESTGGVLEESEILFRLKRPDGFYWETLEPYPELIVTNGELLWNYQPDLLQVTIENWDAERSELAARLLNGEIASIADEYTITATSVADGADHEFFLLPLDSGSMYEKVTLYFAAGELDSIHIDNGNGQKTLWQFYNRRINEPIDDAVFTFDPPADVEVVDNTR